MQTEKSMGQALVMEREQPYPLPENWCWTRVRYLTKNAGKGRTALPGMEDLYLRHYFDTQLYHSQTSSREEGDCVIPLPNPKEQRRIVACVQGLLVNLDKMAQDLGWLVDHEKDPMMAVFQESLEETEKTRKFILDQAFRGKLGTNKPEEESAVELLRKLVEGT